jgi:signal transduction histidine kinase/ligand-binding sensor domain-containing protein/DNA-binding response OmpR family regulator
MKTSNKSSIYSYKKSKLETLFLVLLFTLFSVITKAQEHGNFIQLSPKQLKKPLYIINTVQDQQGYIWMAHSSGVAKYDGNTYFYLDLDEILENLDPGAEIIEMKKDYKENVWILTNTGRIAIYNNTGNFSELNFAKTNAIKRIYPINNSVILSSNLGEINIFSYKNNFIKRDTSITNIIPSSSQINSIVEDRNKDLFIGTSKGEIFQYSMFNKEYTEIDVPFLNGLVFPNLTIDFKNRLWIGTETLGVFVYDIQTKKFIRNKLFKAPFYNIKSELIKSLFCDSSGYIWAGTDGSGLFRIDPNSGFIQLFTHHKNNQFSLSSNTIMRITEDTHKNIWTLSNYGEVNIFPLSSNNIIYYEGSYDNTPTKTLSIFKSNNGNLWLGTDGFGITKINSNQDGTTSTNQYLTNNGKGYYVQSIEEDDRANIWIGTYKHGLWYHNTKNKSFKRIQIVNSKLQHASDVRTIFKDKKNRIWVASNLGLYVYTSSLKLLATFENNKAGLTGNIGQSFLQDKNGKIWIGYRRGGLFQFNENELRLKNSSFTNISYSNENFSDVETLGINWITEDSLSNLWILNFQGNLYKYNYLTKSYSSFKNYKPFEDIHLRSLQLEDNNNLWMGSNKGIIHFNLKDSVTINYHSADGLQDDLFLRRSSFKDKEGMLYFGGIKGVNSFNPKNLLKKESSPTLHFNSLEILNQPARFIVPDQINSNINDIQHLTLNPDQSSFSFRFSAFDNILHPNYQYEYRLHGFNNDWIAADREQLATYTNIPSGKFTFEVRAGTKKGVWDIPAKKINIIIKQPLWNLPLAYLGYLIIILFMSLWIKRWYSLKKKLFTQNINSKKEKELHDTKMIFFAKMAHEIQTPLTLISTPINEMLSKSEGSGNLLHEQRLQIISNNVKRLSRIVFELTTVRNKEFQKIRLKVTKNNLYEDLNKIAISFKEQARFKNIDFSINCPKNLSEIWYDKDKFEHVIYNLLSNAFKFTPKEGNIQLIAVPINNKNSIKIAISDSGTGISKEELENIFTLFYQSKTGKNLGGTGIGLALTKELIDLHRGKIDVKSTPNDGAEFTFVIPIAKDAYLKEERFELPPNKIEIEKPEIDQTTSQTPTIKKNRTILVVEDNIELQMFLRDLLSPIYNVILTENGEEGFQNAKIYLPDLILSDVMMPKINGIEMTKLLREHKFTKHIPIVLLTAKNSTNIKISGLESGAIELINKPFNSPELLLKINNIISSKEHIIAKYKKEIISKPVIEISKSPDDVFTEILYKAINSNIENSNFKIEELADILNISYSVLYRKCLRVTGKSLVDLIRLQRLNKAAIIIAKYGYNVSEVAFMTGFNDPKYFSKCFKKEFGKNPNIFKKEALEIGSKKYLKKFKLNAL